MEPMSITGARYLKGLNENFGATLFRTRFMGMGTLQPIAISDCMYISNKNNSIANIYELLKTRCPRFDSL